ncbi:MAG: outer membrane protein assembly factor BamC [Gammaproteobacteria bacterium]|jgi:outer membrane protein assembly factor BamC
MKSVLMVTLSTIVSLVVIGCGTTQDLRYLDSQSAKQLEIPPDLTVTYELGDFVLPDNFSSDFEDSKTIKSVPVLLKVDSLQLEGQAGFHWLSVNDSVDDIFQSVRNFWLSEGYLIETDEPAIGLLETEWVYKYEGTNNPNVNFLMRLISSDDFTATQNQFRTRIERDKESGKNRIYISHRGTAYKHILQTKQNESEKQNNWELVPPNSEFEVEMLSRLMIYLGVQQAEIDQQLEHIKLFTTLASIHADYSQNETYLLVKDIFSKTFYRTLHQLDRMGVEVVSSNIDAGIKGVITKGIIQVKTDVEEEIIEGGFFSFGGEVKIVKKQILLVLTEESSHVTRISMVNTFGEIENSKPSVEFITILQQFLK